MSSSEAVITFGGGALLLFAAVYFFYDRTDRKGNANNAVAGPRPFNITFARLYGLITIAVLGVALAFSSSADKELSASAFTLLGTVAGYLGGAKATSAGAVGGPSGSGAANGSAAPTPGLAEEHL